MCSAASQFYVNSQNQLVRQSIGLTVARQVTGQVAGAVTYFGLRRCDARLRRFDVILDFARVTNVLHYITFLLVWHGWSLAYAGMTT